MNDAACDYCGNTHGAGVACPHRRAVQVASSQWGVATLAAATPLRMPLPPRDELRLAMVSEAIKALRPGVDITALARANLIKLLEAE